MKIAVGQIHSVIGDFRGNTDRILETSRRAADQGADLVVFPELCICGYPPMDLLDYDDFIDRNIESVRFLTGHLPKDVSVALGYVERNSRKGGKALRNAVAVISDGRVIHTQYKAILPTYDVFDEARYFEPGEKWETFQCAGRSVGIAVCEDIWWENGEPPTRNGASPVKELLLAGADLIIVPSASPFFGGRCTTRRSIVTDIVRRHHIPMVYVNMVGGNDSIIFDGNSFVVTPEGPIASAAGFREDLVIVEPFEEPVTRSFPPENRWKDIAESLIFGLSEYAGRCGFSRVHLGLSGGIDSAVTACIAVEALEPGNVSAIAMPSRYSSTESLEDARALADALGIRLEILSIEDIFSSSLATLDPLFQGLDQDVTEENLQARIRGMLLMAYSNKFHSLLLETGNKSELATGYCTLYGDMCGGIAPIGDLFKTEVFELARFFNRDRRVIPERILLKPPSAELRPDQKDEDSLPPYPVLDGILKCYLMDNLAREGIVERGYDRDTVVRVLGLVARSEYKRIQAPPVLKVSPRAFGTGRRIPVARFIHEV